MGHTVLGLVIAVCVLWTVALAETSSAWSYECQKGVCVKVEPLDKASSVSFPVCRLFCGSEVGTLWPYPNGKVNVNSTLYHFDVNSVHFKPVTPASLQSLWTEVQDRFIHQVNNKVPKYYTLVKDGKSVTVNVEIESDDTYFTLTTDESYKLTISLVNDGVVVTIFAPSFYGARNAIETLSQLIVFDDLRSELLIAGDIYIEDAPVFKHRGLILDTSRNYFSLQSIKRTIDAMAMSKLNIFHWHITDSHSFPLVLKSEPDLVKYGAYTPYKIYSSEDVKEVVHYAKVRGVVVLPEFDAPAHVGEGWQKKDLTACFNAQPWASFCVEPPCGQLDPTRDELYNVLENIYKEMVDMFDHPYTFHMGGDEVSVSCWNSSTRIQDWMKAKGWKLEESDFIKLWGYFQESAVERLDKVSKGKKPIILWTSRLTDVPYVDQYLDKERYFIQIWTKGDDSKITDLINLGFKLIISNYDALYFDCGFGGWVNDGNNWCSPYIGWHKVYDNDLDQISSGKLDQVLGAEAALWSEQADEYSVDARFWPRASALGERLWSNPKTKWRDAEARMLVHREQLVANGISAESIQPEWCLQNENECPYVRT